ncbi:serine/threonine-protein kinase BIK1 isoform X2 [Cucumis sativus]|uniref:Protein kinase domain-containing protein n=1 Tax=Cucumis sativus TaxID=3659 RepID=A0A0A0KPY2_CUCSA|nr:serine/threonine-protein kinase BIK1 isoform X2 [Cucumis sativus]
MADFENGNVLIFTFEDLKSFTNNFNGNNLIGITQSGRFYRGQLRPPWLAAIITETRIVTVKIWDQKQELEKEKVNQLYFQEELKLITHQSLRNNPSLAKLIGYCCEDGVKGFVYDLNPLGLLQNLMARDDRINWFQRVDVILELARLLDFIHSQENQSLGFHFSASNILLDWDCKPKLCRFKPISDDRMNADLYKLSKFTQLPSGYFHPSIRGESEGKVNSDVYSLGEILLGLIAKRDVEPQNLEKQNHQEFVNSSVSIWAKNEYRPNVSLVHESLQKDWGYSTEEGIKLTELAMHSIEFFPRNRPSIKQILQHLEALQVTRRLSDDRPRKKERKLPSSSVGM